MIFEKPPKGFKSRFEVASCFIMCRGRLLVVQRADDDTEGGKWAFPGGTVEKGETIKEAVVREIKEEIGLGINEEDVAYIKKIYVKYPKHDFIYNMFYAEFADMPEIRINHEHKGFIWLPPKDALGLDMVNDGRECVELFISIMH
jgi:8-oxo-dGTP diphosphatase